MIKFEDGMVEVQGTGIDVMSDLSCIVDSIAKRSDKGVVLVAVLVGLYGDAKPELISACAHAAIETLERGEDT